MSMTIPFVDLRDQHDEVRADIEARITDVINRSSFIGGTYVTAFEREFAEYIGTQEAIGVANGTDALWLGLAAIGVSFDDAVITVPNTFIATVEAISRAGAHPIFVDIDLRTANIDINALGKLLEEECRVENDGKVIHVPTRRRVAAIMPVHLYGLPADMKPLMEIANQYHLPVIEDACQAHGTQYMMNGEWKRAGTFGAVTGFSFYPGKNLGAMGDAGAVVTDDPEIAGKIRWLHDHGQSEKYVHETPDGWNSRLDALQAAILSVKLKKLDDWNARRRQVADYYREALADLPLEVPYEPENARHIYHLYVVRSQDRELLRQGLNSRGIGTGLHYPIPLHLQKAYQHLNYTKGDFPNTEVSAATGLSLPMHQALTEEQVFQVANACAEILGIKSY